MREFIKLQGISTIILAPYSYNVAPAELYFAHFKQANINKSREAVGKRNFAKLAQLVHKRMLQIQPYHIVMMWHRVTLELFECLKFKRL